MRADSFNPAAPFGYLDEDYLLHAAPVTVSRDAQGQVRLAQMFAADHRGRIMHVTGLGWYAWDGKRWAQDTGDKRTRFLATEFLINTFSEAVSREDGALKRAVSKYSSASGVRGILSLAEVDPGVSAAVNELDADEYLLNVDNGTLDLRTLELRDHDPTDRITHVTRAAYRPGEDGGQWGRFLKDVLPADDVRDFLQHYVGQGLVGTPLEHKLAVFNGTGRNGKSVFYGALEHALGSYAATVTAELFMDSRGIPMEKLDLRGLRWAVASESAPDAALSVEQVKSLTGGDKVKGRRLYQDYVEFTPSHTLALITNDLPRAKNDDEALWARLRVVPFEVSFLGREDKELPDRLKAAADEVLAWSVEGWKKYRDNDYRLVSSPTVDAATGTYRLDNDELAPFLRDTCKFGAHQWVTVNELYAAYENWCHGNGVTGSYLLSKIKFGKALGRRPGITQPEGKRAGARYWSGVTMLGR